MLDEQEERTTANLITNPIPEGPLIVEYEGNFPAWMTRKVGGVFGELADIAIKGVLILNLAYFATTGYSICSGNSPSEIEQEVIGINQIVNQSNLDPWAKDVLKISAFVFHNSTPIARGLAYCVFGEGEE